MGDCPWVPSKRLTDDKVQDLQMIQQLVDPLAAYEKESNGLFGPEIEPIWAMEEEVLDSRRNQLSTNKSDAQKIRENRLADSKGAP